MVKINGQEYVVDELTVAQDELIAEIIALLESDAVLLGGEINVFSLAKSLGEKKLLRRFLSVVLVPAGEEFDESKCKEIEQQVAMVKSSAVMEVIEDFLHKNAGWMQKLYSYFLPPEQPAETDKKAAESASTKG